MTDAPILGTSGNDVLALAVDTSLSFTWVPDPGNTWSEYESVQQTAQLTQPRQHRRRVDSAGQPVTISLSP
jgi:hypothetical protein